MVDFDGFGRGAPEGGCAVGLGVEFGEEIIFSDTGVAGLFWVVSLIEVGYGVAGRGCGAALVGVAGVEWWGFWYGDLGASRVVVGPCSGSWDKLSGCGSVGGSANSGSGELLPKRGSQETFSKSESRV